MKTYAGIPIQNLWLLMLYASDLKLTQLRQAIQYLDTPYIHDSLVAWLIQCLEQYLQQPQQHYVSKQQALAYIRGKVDIQRSYLTHSLMQGQVHCQFAQLSFNSAEHQYLYSVIDKLLNHTKPEHHLALKHCQRQLVQLGVQVIGRPLAPKHVTHRALSELLALADVLLNFKIPSTKSGQQMWQQPQDDVRWLRQLFERAIGGFYKKYLTQRWRVLQGTVLRWPQTTQHIALPQMKSDVILTHQDGRCILMDTKFTQIWTQGYYRKQDLFKSPHLYQLYTYLRSQEDSKSRFDFTQGILIYPSIGQTVTADFQLHGYQLSFYTLDLTQDQQGIEQQLLGFIGSSRHTDCDHISWPDKALDRLA
ncbi:hypothetical protein [uncultured Acinetobacter sp.]|uniref:5-methylcytosine restriction system specificity protein McrC n=1 Tax=uncultured Acinetobacter sp. TaxID=165433 RepID=UPI002633D67D|nr:hypothetical protein [uncultured Acinetobacter sp.]